MIYRKLFNAIILRYWYGKYEMLSNERTNEKTNEPNE